ELRERVRKARADLKEAAAQCALAADLDRIRQEGADWEEGRWTFPKLAERYAEVFRIDGLEVLGPDREGTAKRLADHPQHQRLLTALEDWAALTRAEAERERLFAVVAAANQDADSFRNRWRKALARSDRAALLTLVGEVDLDTLPAPLFIR